MLSPKWRWHSTAHLEHECSAVSFPLVKSCYRSQISSQLVTYASSTGFNLAGLKCLKGMSSHETDLGLCNRPWSVQNLVLQTSLTFEIPASSDLSISLSLPAAVAAAFLPPSPASCSAPDSFAFLLFDFFTLVFSAPPSLPSSSFDFEECRPENYFNTTKYQSWTSRI